MGVFGSLITGSACGCLFIYLLPNDYYRIFSYNLRRPISKELDKDEVDVLKIFQLSVWGAGNTVSDVWNKWTQSRI